MPFQVLLKKFRTPSIGASIGYGIGFSHGFGVGLSLKPRLVNPFQFLGQAVTKMMTKFGVSQNLSIGQGILPKSKQSGERMTNQASPDSPEGNMMQFGGAAKNLIQGLPEGKNLGKGLPSENIQSQGVLARSSLGSQTEKVISSSPQALREDSELKETNDAHLQAENRMLHMVLKHDQLIEELMEEKEKLRQILVEDLKISPDKLDSRPKNSTRSKTESGGQASNRI